MASGSNHMSGRKPVPIRACGQRTTSRTPMDGFRSDEFVCIRCERFGPLVLTLAAVAVLLLSLTASALTARHAASVGPMRALRAE